MMYCLLCSRHRWKCVYVCVCACICVYLRADLIIYTTPWGRSYNHLHFMDEETDDKRLRNLLRITQLVNSGAGLLSLWSSSVKVQSLDMKQHWFFIIIAQAKDGKQFQLCFQRDILITVSKDLLPEYSWILMVLCLCSSHLDKAL